MGEKIALIWLDWRSGVQTGEKKFLAPDELLRKGVGVFEGTAYLISVPKGDYNLFCSTKGMGKEYRRGLGRTGVSGRVGIRLYSKIL